MKRAGITRGKCQLSPSHVLDLKQRQKVIIFYTFSGRVRDSASGHCWVVCMQLGVARAVGDAQGVTRDLPASPQGPPGPATTIQCR